MEVNHQVTAEGYCHDCGCFPDDCDVTTSSHDPFHGEAHFADPSQCAHERVGPAPPGRCYSCGLAGLLGAEAQRRFVDSLIQTDPDWGV